MALLLLQGVRRQARMRTAVGDHGGRLGSCHHRDAAFHPTYLSSDCSHPELSGEPLAPGPGSVAIRTPIYLYFFFCLFSDCMRLLDHGTTHLYRFPSTVLAARCDPPPPPPPALRPGLAWPTRVAQQGNSRWKDKRKPPP